MNKFVTLSKYENNKNPNRYLVGRITVGIGFYR